MVLLQLAASAKALYHVASLGNVTIDSSVFRLHHKATFGLLILCSLLVTSVELIGKAIECIPGSKLVGQGPKAASAYCYVQHTFSVRQHFASCDVGEVCNRKVVGLDVPHHGVGPIDPDLARPGPGSWSNEHVVYHTYYIWVPFVLFFQAVAFYAPHWLWKMWEAGTTKQLSDGLQGKIVKKEAVLEKTAPVTGYLVNSWHLHDMFAVRYILCEALTFVNVICQLWFINWFLGGVFMDYGSQVLEFANTDPENRTDPMILLFPRITKCTFLSVGPSGSFQRTDLLCILAANIINEKIYIFLWFWFIILAVATGLNLIYRLVPFFTDSAKFWFLQKRAGHSSDMNALQRVVRRSKIGDFYILFFLSQNMSSATFGKLIDNLAEALDMERKPPVFPDENDDEYNGDEYPEDRPRTPGGGPRVPAGYAKTALAKLGLAGKNEDMGV